MRFKWNVFIAEKPFFEFIIKALSQNIATGDADIYFGKSRIQKKYQKKEGEITKNIMNVTRRRKIKGAHKDIVKGTASQKSDLASIILVLCHL